MNFLRGLRIIIWFIIFSIPVVGQETVKWVHCSGEAVVQNITTEEAQVIAKRHARLNAIEKVCGVSLQAESLVKDFILAGDFVQSVSYGQVVGEKNVTWKTETLKPEKAGTPPVILFRVEMKAKVVPVKGEPDLSFKVDLKLNKKIFQSGDEVILNIMATKDCYLTVLNLAANDSVYILFPNKFQRDNFISAKKGIEIPDQKYRDAGFHIRVTNLPGHKKDSEVVKVIATKQKMYFSDEVDTSRSFGLIGIPRVAVTKLARWLSDIPISQRAEAAVMYTVQSD